MPRYRRRTLGAFFAVLVLPWTTSAQPSLVDETLPCLQPVQGVTWMRWDENRPTLDLWCKSVGRAILEPRFGKPGDNVVGLRILSWNVQVGAGRLEELLPRLLKESADLGLGLVVLLQETFRTGATVPESYPPALKVPRAIRPRRPTMDIRGLAERFGLSVAYVPSMRNGSATGVMEREDRGNAILSTEFLSDVKAIELPFGKQRRVAVTAAVLPRSTGTMPSPVRVITAHFDNGDHRVAQAVALSERVLYFSDYPIVIGGDLNSRRGVHDGTVVALGYRVPLASCGTGRTNRWPLRLDVLFPIARLDFMFAGTSPASGIVRTCTTLRQAYGSDHLPLLMTLEY